MDGPRFTAIIVNYNGQDTLLGAIDSALREGIPLAQIIVVDNGSVNDSLDQAERFASGISILRNGCNAGFASAVNRGIRAARSEFLLLLNNDAQLESGALQAFARAFERTPALAIAGGQLRYPDGRLQSAFAPLPHLREELIPMNFLKWVNPKRYVRSTTALEEREVESVFGACLAVRALALQVFGLLDEDFFFYFEEVEWCRRARLAGYGVHYIPGARALHLLGHTTKRYRGDARIELHRSKLLYFRKCESTFAFRTLSGFLVLRTLINALSGTLACLFTLGVPQKLRSNTRDYWRMFFWHLRGRPSSWGLPGKCSAQQLAAIEAGHATLPQQRDGNADSPRE